MKFTGDFGRVEQSMNRRETIVRVGELNYDEPNLITGQSHKSFKAS